jgi:hypothetical protein
MANDIMAALELFCRDFRYDVGDKALQKNVIHLSGFLNSSVPTNIFKLYLSVPKPMNINLYSSVFIGHR